MLRNQKSGELTEESTVLSEYPNTSFPLKEHSCGEKEKDNISREEKRTYDTFRRVLSYGQPWTGLETNKLGQSVTTKLGRSIEFDTLWIQNLLFGKMPT